MSLLRVPIYILLFAFFFMRSFIEYGLLPDNMIIAAIPDLLILGLFAVASVRRTGFEPVDRPIGTPIVLAFIGVMILSALWNAKPLPSIILFSRLVLRFYVMFWALIQFDVSEYELSRYLFLVWILLVIQIPTAAIKCAIYGQGEMAIGTYSMSGGGNSTAIPMVATGFLLTYHWTYRRSMRCLLGVLAFTAFGLIGGKRAVFLMVPLTCVFAAVNAQRYAIGGVQTALRHYFLVAMVGAVVFYVGVRLCPTLTPEGEIGGSFDLDHLYSYIVQYDTHETQDGYTTGRFSTTVRSLEYVVCDPATALLGFGPGHVMKSRVGGVGRETSVDVHGTSYGGGDARLGITYGLTGFSWLLLQVGGLGTVVWLGFYAYLAVVLRRMAEQEQDPFWRAYDLGMVCFSAVVLFLSILYGSFMISGDLLTFLYYLLLAIGFLHWKHGVSWNAYDCEVLGGPLDGSEPQWSFDGMDLRGLDDGSVDWRQGRS